ncbi:hypothetical protein bthur0003_36530 [Bacillus thuringiensis serovar thuringiensis str. T01001]|nr:hypothetical protein bthur0003_36530 [Bacillus thuringiensis serovar thuringiensis str. T01001]
MPLTARGIELVAVNANKKIKTIQIIVVSFRRIKKVIIVSKQIT